MKYPQLVSMPSAVQDWLDQQLEARGIDAVVYTRYVFSLLQKDSLDLPDDLLVLNKAKEGGRRGQTGRKRVHREECLSAWDDCEKLKRSAVVQCLLSASDQKFGIEKLVDELCSKLKEIESESDNSVYFALAESSKQSKQLHVPNHVSLDETQKYYAAFPPLSSRFIDSAINISALPQVNSVWNTGTKTSSLVLGKKRNICSTVLTEKIVNRKEWKQNKENVQENSWKEVGRENTRLRDQLNEKCFPHRSDMGCRLAWDMADNTNDSSLEACSFGDTKLQCESGVFSCINENERAVSPRRLYQRQVNAAHYGSDLQVQFKNGNYSVSKRMLEDKNLAQLIAKFDHSIEALWSPSEADDRPLSPCVLSSQLEKNGDQPPAQSSPGVSLGNPFIPSGTNITTSIWSENEDSIGNKNQSSEQIAQTCQSSKNYSMLAVKNEDNLNAVIWNKAESLPSVLTSLPIELNYGFTSFAPNINQKWSDVENLNTVENYSQFGQIFNSNFNDFQETLNCSITSGGLHGSFTALNHNKQDSSFTEVIPKTIADSSNYMDMRMESINVSLVEEQPLNWEVEEEDLLTSARTHFRPIKQESLDSQKSNITGYADGTTFLIPDGLETLPFQRSASGALYLESDIPAKYMEYKEKELFGGRNKGEELISIAPEFVPKFKIQQNEKCCQTEEMKCGISNDEEVDSKRSRQDIGAEDVEGNFFFPGDEQLADKVDDETSVKKSGCSNCRLSEVNYLAPFFQTDFACLEHGDIKTQGVDVECVSNNDQEMSQVWNEKLKICDCKDTKLWKTDGSVLLTGEEGKVGNWEPEKSPRSWSDIWSSNIEVASKPCEKCEVAPSVGYGSSKHGLNLQSLREELSQDGEQLLSDLSYMQHMFLGSDWSEDSRELSVSKCLEDKDDGNQPSAEKFQCISPGTIDDQELEMYADDTVYSHSLPSKQNVKGAVGEGSETKSVSNVFTKCLRSTHATTVLPSPKLEVEWRLNERPFHAKTTPKDRKRRHSASLRASSLACQDSAPVVPRAQTACVKGVACPAYVLNAMEALRPVTL